MAIHRGLWLRLPILVRALLTGIATALAGTAPWSILLSANTRYQSALPWAVPIMAVYLWFYWRYLVRGWGWPRSTAGTRRTDSRANRLAGDTWGPALLAGMLGLASVLLLQGVLGRLVALPQQRDIHVSQHPVVTVFLWIVSAFDLLTRGRSEWQLAGEPRPLIWETGPDAAFWGNVGALLIIGAVAIWAYSLLAAATRAARASGAA